MWSPTHVQVLVKRAKGINIKGKNGTNDAFVTIALAKEKYQTSVKEKATDTVEWCEQCELSIPQQGNTAEIILTLLHRNFLGVDEFLGLVSIPLSDFDVYERPKTKWYQLKCKSGQSKTDYRGELEVRTSFTVKSVSKETGSTADLTGKKEKGHKGSLQSLNKAGSKIGGSLLSLGTNTKEKLNLKKLAKTVGHKVEKAGEKAKRSMSKTNLSGKEKDSSQQQQHQQDLNSSFGSSTLPSKVKVKDFDLEASFNSTSKDNFHRAGSGKNRDPGVHSDDEDDMFKFDALSHRSSGSSLNVTNHGNSNNLGLVSKTSTPISGSVEDIGLNMSGSGKNDLYRKSFGTPASARKEAPNSNVGTPKSSRSFLLESGSGKAVNKRLSEPVLDEWEAKLLGKKGAVPFKSPDEDTNFGSKSNVSQASHGSPQSFSTEKSRTLPEPQPRQLKSSTPAQDTPSGRRKIFPIAPELESPETPKTPADSFSSPSPKKWQNSSEDSKGRQRLSSRVSEEGEVEEEKKHKTIGLKLKNSYRNLVETGRTGSLFNLTHIGKGFKDKDKEDKRLSSSRDLRISNESLGQPYHHSRNQSDGSTGGHNMPPSGTRVVLGRETTPTPSNSNRIPKEYWDRFEGRSREDLIEMIINLQGRVETQAKKQSELEDYIDSLLTKVIANAPNLLQKNGQLEHRYGAFIK